MGSFTDRDFVLRLACPTTKLGIELLPRPEAEKRISAKLCARPPLPNASGRMSDAAGLTDLVLLRKDNHCAYPVIEGIPILLAPEMLAAEAPLIQIDLADKRYAEAYEEMEFYNSRASETLDKLKEVGALGILPTEMAATQEEKATFPDPWYRWADSTHDLAAQMESYRHLGGPRGRRFLQLGGSGTHAIKFAMAGAEEVWLVTPMLAEARIATALAASAGVGPQFKAVVGIAEELPIQNEFFDAVFAGGCLHHTVTDLALAEAARVLRKSGKFSAAEPWKAPLYAFGTRLLGKREDAYCRPLTAQRLEKLDQVFSESQTIRHGTFFRYPLLALEKIGLTFPKRFTWYIGKIDDFISSLVPGLRRFGSSIAVLGKK